MVKRRRYSELDPEPHGTRELTFYLLRDCPGTFVRSYGRRLIGFINGGCDRCILTDRTVARLSRIHADYRRRRR